jgi:hypothetical protein
MNTSLATFLGIDAYYWVMILGLIGLIVVWVVLKKKQQG